MPAKSHYEVLGLTKEATADEIKKAYRNLVHKHHPDKNQDDKEATARMQEINQAYATLSDKGKREAYDLGQENGTGEDLFGSHGAHFREDVMEYFARAHAQAMRGNGFNSPFFNGMEHQVNGDVSLTMEEVIKGTTKNVLLVIQEVKSDGKGITVTDHQHNATIRIPPGFGNGMVLRTEIEFKGEKRLVNIQTRLEPHDRFGILTDYNLVTSVTISYPTAILGGSVEVTMIDGTKEKLKIPENTKVGTLIQAKEQGLPRSPRNLTRSDLFFSVNIEIPEKVDEETKKLLRKLQAKLEQPHSKPTS